MDQIERFTQATSKLRFVQGEGGLHVPALELTHLGERCFFVCRSWPGTPDFFQIRSIEHLCDPREACADVKKVCPFLLDDLAELKDYYICSSEVLRYLHYRLRHSLDLIAFPKAKPAFCIGCKKEITGKIKAKLNHVQFMIKSLD